MMMKSMNEFKFIKRYLSPLTKGFAGALNLNDDAAVLKLSKDTKIVISVDNFVLGTHCPLELDISKASTRAILTAATDLVAMAAEPICLFISISIPKPINGSILKKIRKGVSLGLKLSSLHLAGGDTVAYDGNLCLSVTVVGKASDGKVLTRKGAKPGDLLVVTGNIGDGMIGLECLQKKYKKINNLERKSVIKRFLTPVPNYQLSYKLKYIANACIDISDGLIADVGHMAAASNCGLKINSLKIPLSKSGLELLKRGEKKIQDYVVGGDDYEIAFAIPKSKIVKAKTVAKNLKTKISVVGEFTKKSNILFDNIKLSKGFKHF